MSPKGVFGILLAGGLLVAGCGKPRSEWRVTVESSGICGMGIKTERQAEQRMLESSAHTLTSILADERFWTDYVNANPSLPALNMEERKITPRTINADGLVVLALKFTTPTPLEDAAAQARIERAVKDYLKDDRRRAELEALTHIRAQKTALADKTDPASMELAQQYERRLAEFEAQVERDGRANEDVIRLTISGT